MGFLKKLFGGLAAVQQLPAGTITVDRDGAIITSTVSSTYPKELLQTIARDVLQLLLEARASQMPLAEVSLHFGSLRITARELRGGVIIFLLPQTAMMPTHTPQRP
ncbi:MAG: hypothetical protein JF609_02570 [Verrucomicrobia bacterium]|nr:hypothetical protein [Verrucomicrobiota bacterium]